MDRSISRRMLARAQHLRVDISAPQSGRKIFDDALQVARLGYEASFPGRKQTPAHRCQKQSVLSDTTEGEA